MWNCVLADSKHSGVEISEDDCILLMSGCMVKGHGRFGVLSSGNVSVLLSVCSLQPGEKEDLAIGHEAIVA